MTAKKYAFVTRPGHPLATAEGLVAEHRVVLFSLLGPGWHPCFHCGVQVEWRRGKLRDSRKGMLIVDHLDNDPLNNAPENLVPSCYRCNTSVRRAGHMITEDEKSINYYGKLARAVEVKCLGCDQAFLTRKSGSEARALKYCSDPCRLTARKSREWRDMVKDDEPFIMIGTKRSRAVSITCHCGREFLVPKFRKDSAKSCSKSCAQKLRMHNKALRRAQ